MKTIIDILKEDSFELVYKASTRGGEYRSACPWCGGNDRFIVHAEKGVYYCRQCKESGNALTYLKKKKGLNYIQACNFLGSNPNLNYKTKELKKGKCDGAGNQPAIYKTVSTPWQDKITSLHYRFFKNLFQARCSSILAYLNKRGIDISSAAKYRIGYNMASCSYQIDDNNVWLPEGIVIPTWDQNLIRIRIRQQSPAVDKNGKPQNKYVVASGSSTEPMILVDDIDANNPVLIVESELDAIMLHSKFGKTIDVIALGSSVIRPSQKIIDWLTDKDILLCLDFDAAGIKEMAWWVKKFKNIIKWPVSIGKDPGEMFQAGGNLNKWIEIGVKKIKNNTSNSDDDGIFCCDNGKVVQIEKICSNCIAVGSWDDGKYRDKILCFKKAVLFAETGKPDFIENLKNTCNDWQPNLQI